MNASTAPLTESEQAFLFALARESLVEFGRSGLEPFVNEAEMPRAVGGLRSCFVTLTRHGQLRGCIGNLVAREPLFRAVIHSAIGAGYRDSRFPPVMPAEIPELEIEVSVLTEPVPLTFGSPEELLQKLRPGVDGVVLKGQGWTATFLPQVWEKIPAPVDFLNQLALKAGLPEAAWRSNEVTVLTYEVESFSEGTC